MFNATELSNIRETLEYVVSDLENLEGDAHDAQSNLDYEYERAENSESAAKDLADAILGYADARDMFKRNPDVAYFLTRLDDTRDMMIYLAKQFEKKRQGGWA